MKTLNKERSERNYSKTRETAGKESTSTIWESIRSQIHVPKNEWEVHVKRENMQTAWNRVMGIMLQRTAEMWGGISNIENDAH